MRRRTILKNSALVFAAGVAGCFTQSERPVEQKTQQTVSETSTRTSTVTQETKTTRTDSPTSPTEHTEPIQRIDSVSVNEVEQFGTLNPVEFSIQFGGIYQFNNEHLVNAEVETEAGVKGVTKTVSEEKMTVSVVPDEGTSKNGVMLEWTVVLLNDDGETLDEVMGVLESYERDG